MSNPKYGSLQVHYSYPADDAATSIELLTNIQGVKQFNVGPEILRDVTLIVSSTQAGASDPIFAKIQCKLGTDVVDESDFSLVAEDFADFDVRIFFFDQFISVHVNDKWVYSYALAAVSYSEDITASIKLDGATTTITGIRRVELSDGREAVFVDYESTTDNAIQSIIQQRPVQIYPHVNRKLTFTYAAEKDTVPAVFVNSYEESVTDPANMSSDGLVYANDVGVSIDVETAREVGFITRLYRLSELNTGAESATRTIQKQARERSKMITVDQRLDPRLEISDVLHVSFTASATGRVIDKLVIVEDVRIAIRDGDYTMSITGREKSS